MDMLPIVTALAVAALAFPATAQEREVPPKGPHEPATHEGHEGATHQGHEGRFELRVGLEAPIIDHVSFDVGSATFSDTATQALTVSAATTSDGVLAPRTVSTFAGWALLLICLVAAGLTLRGFGQRLEEYR